jgi:hypothetical protein
MSPSVAWIVAPAAVEEKQALLVTKFGGSRHEPICGVDGRFYCSGGRKGTVSIGVQTTAWQGNHHHEPICSVASRNPAAARNEQSESQWSGPPPLIHSHLLSMFAGQESPAALQP